MKERLTVLTSLLMTNALASNVTHAPLTEQGPPPPGRVVEQRVPGDMQLPYYLYVPTSGVCDARVMVSVHGISRNAREHARHLAPLAERYGVILIAPLFASDSFRDYQRLGRAGKGPRADQALDRVVANALRITGANARQLHLFGYSGGGQFVHRYAMAHPERVAAVAIGAAGWYTFPTPARDYPLGLGGPNHLPGVHFDPARFLRIPMSVLVGEQDNARDGELNRSRRIDRQQGRSRLERGRRWIEAMSAAAKAHGLNTPYRFEILPGADHSFVRSMRRGGMGERVFDHLFATRPDTPAPVSALDRLDMAILPCRPPEQALDLPS